MAINTLFQNIADAIRERGGTSAALTPAQMPAAIAAIPAGGEDPGHFAHFDFKKSATDEISNITAQLTGCQITPAGLSFTAASQNCLIPNVYFQNCKIEIKFGAINFKGSSSNHVSILMLGSADSSNGLLRRNNGNLSWYLSSWQDMTSLSSINDLANKTLTVLLQNGYLYTYIDGVLQGNPSYYSTAFSNNNWNIGNTRGGASGGQFYDVIVESVDLYYAPLPTS